MDEDDHRQKQREQGNLQEASKLWRAWKTVKEMVRDRGYDLADEEVDITFDEFRDKYKDEDGTIKYAPASSTQQRWIFTNPFDQS